MAYFWAYMEKESNTLIENNEWLTEFYKHVNQPIPFENQPEMVIWVSKQKTIIMIEALLWMSIQKIKIQCFYINLVIEHSLVMTQETSYFGRKLKKNRLTLGRRSRMAQKKDASVQSVPMPYRFVLDDMTLLFGAKQEKMATRWVFKTIIHNMQKYREELIVS